MTSQFSSDATLAVVGIDLSGPSNPADTCAVVFAGKGNVLQRLDAVEGAGDDTLWNLLSTYTSQPQLVVGIDAPLSYNAGGGIRPGDRRLRQQLTTAGYSARWVMPPTMTRMAYLTLRGLAVARMLQALRPRPAALVEVHPIATMLLRGAPSEHVGSMKCNMGARRSLLAWLGRQSLRDIAEKDPTDHYVAACAAALAAWKWWTGTPAWLEPAAPPWHPFDYAC